MNSVILRTTTRYLIALLLLLSVFLLLRGHNLPGGGFIGGLVGAAAFSLYSLAYGVEKSRYVLRFAPSTIIGSGLVCALVSGLLALTTQEAFLSGLWLELSLGSNKLKLGTPLLFDIGVYLVVLGVALTIVFALEEL